MFGASVNDIWLGNAHEGSGWSGGDHRVDDLRIYDRPLLAAEHCALIGGKMCGNTCRPP